MNFSDFPSLQAIENVTINIGKIFSEEDIDEKTAEGFLDFLIDLRNKGSSSAFGKTLAKGLETITSKFIGNKHICMKVLISIEKRVHIDEEGDKTSVLKLSTF